MIKAGSRPCFFMPVQIYMRMVVKRVFDIVASLIILVSFSWLLLIVWLLSACTTKSGGIFLQKRIGRFGTAFTIIKFRTMREGENDVERITPISASLRNAKLDELPQLINVLIGNMSIVGPRPDIPGYYDKLEGEDRKILNLRPGLTSPASIKYFNEEKILAGQAQPDVYNDTVFFPDKVRMNLQYYYTRSFLGDLKIIWKTIFRDKSKLFNSKKT